MDEDTGTRHEFRLDNKRPPLPYWLPGLWSMAIIVPAALWLLKKTGQYCLLWFHSPQYMDIRAVLAVAVSAISFSTFFVIVFYVLGIRPHVLALRLFSAVLVLEERGIEIVTKKSKHYILRSDIVRILSCGGQITLIWKVKGKIVTLDLYDFMFGAGAFEKFVKLVSAMDTYVDVRHQVIKMRAQFKLRSFRNNHYEKVIGRAGRGVPE